MQATNIKETNKYRSMANLNGKSINGLKTVLKYNKDYAGMY